MYSVLYLGCIVILAFGLVLVLFLVLVLVTLPPTHRPALPLGVCGGGGGTPPPAAGGTAGWPGRRRGSNNSKLEPRAWAKHSANAPRRANPLKF